MIMTMRSMPVKKTKKGLRFQIEFVDHVLNYIKNIHLEYYSINNMQTHDKADT